MGATGSPAVTAAPVQVGTYDLAESGPAGFTASDWVCTGAATATTTSVTLAEGEYATCTITNTAVAPKLTLVKAVDTPPPVAPRRRRTGRSPLTGPTNLSGTSGDPSVTDATVQVGDYALAESGGPAGYSASAWSCVGGVPGTDAVTLGPGDDGDLHDHQHRDRRPS